VPSNSQAESRAAFVDGLFRSDVSCSVIGVESLSRGPSFETASKQRFGLRLRACRMRFCFSIWTTSRTSTTRGAIRPAMRCCKLSRRVSAIAAVILMSSPVSEAPSLRSFNRSMQICQERKRCLNASSANLVAHSISLDTSCISVAALGLLLPPTADQRAAGSLRAQRRPCMTAHQTETSTRLILPHQKRRSVVLVNQQQEIDVGRFDRLMPGY
jgi:hypothetical protein